MKKVFVFVLILLLAACGSENEQFPSDIYYADEMIHWTSVDDAIGYEVKIGDLLFETTINQLSTTNISAGLHDVQIRSVFENAQSIFSPITQIEVIRTFDIPQNLRISNNHLVWQAVDDATGYLVEANGLLYETVLPNFYLLDLYEAFYEITVQTLRGDIVSAKSAIFEVNVIYNQPSKIEIIDDMLSWNVVSDAIAYIITIEGIGVYRTSETTYDLSTLTFSPNHLYKITIMTEFIFDVSFPSKPVYYQTYTHTNQTINETIELPNYEAQATANYTITLPSGITELDIRDALFNDVDISINYHDNLELNARSLYEVLGFGEHQLKIVTNLGIYDFNLTLTTDDPHIISAQKVVFRGFSLVYSYALKEGQIISVSGYNISESDYDIMNQHLIIKASFINQIKQQNPSLSSAVFEVTLRTSDERIITWPITILYQ